MSTQTPSVPESAEIERESAWMRELEGSLGQVIVGQEGLVRGLLIGLLRSNQRSRGNGIGFLFLCHGRRGDAHREAKKERRSQGGA